MRRLLYCLAGSTLLHGALLWAPYPMSAGGAGEDALQPVRVELVYASRSEAPKRPSRQPPQAEQPEADSRAKATKTRPKPKRPEALDRSGIRVAKTAHTAPKRVNPAPAEDTRPEHARKPAGETRGNAGAVTKERLTRGVAKKTPANHGPQPGAGFSPARYARTVPPRYPGKARRSGWEGTTVLKVRVDPKGAPDRVAVDRTSGFDILDAAAVKAVQRWKFHPARRGLDAVPSWVRIPVAFKLKEDKR